MVQPSANTPLECSSLTFVKTCVRRGLNAVLERFMARMPKITADLGLVHLKPSIVEKSCLTQVLRCSDFAPELFNRLVSRGSESNDGGGHGAIAAIAR